MAGYELMGAEERRAIEEIFEKANGVLMAHGFDALRNGSYKVREFERAFAARLGASFGQAVSSGTAALKVALDALEIGPGDEVITQAYTFVATVEAIVATGATPVIVDVDDTLNMDPAAFETAITPRTKVVIPVHMMGESADMDAIVAIARKRGVRILEDAAQALGASFRGRHCGTIGDLGAFSTDGGKTLTTGEGGVVLTSDEQLYLKARAKHDHGHEYSTTLGRGEENALGMGFNYRMSELNGAVGLAQLAKLELIIERQRANKTALIRGLQGLPVTYRRSLDPAGDIGDTIVFFAPNRERATTFVQKMRENGLGTKNLPDAIRWHFSRHWDHMFHSHPLYRGRVGDSWKPSADLLERAIALPVMVKMEPERIERIADTLLKIGREVL